jgi:hypothetical protein
MAYIFLLKCNYTLPFSITILKTILSTISNQTVSFEGTLREALSFAGIERASCMTNQGRKK